MLMGWGIIAAVLAGLAASPARAATEEPLASAWGNTAAACLESAGSAPETHVGGVLLALLLVLALLAAAAWGLKRWPRAAQAAGAESAGRLRMLNRFNARQTFMLWEEGGKAYALVMKDRRVEMMVELPAAPGESGPSPRGGAPAPRTFQALWLNLIKPARRS
jgi:flagellar biogenesis protein FliO